MSLRASVERPCPGKDDPRPDAMYAVRMSGGSMRRRRAKWVDPPGWDEEARKMHEVEPTPWGLLHFATCWCRSAPPADGGADGTEENRG